jgi:prevent-host-death family protein
MKRVTTHEAKTHLSRLLQDVERGEEIIVCRGDRPVARLVSTQEDATAQRPRVGTVTSGAVKIAPDAFTPLGGAALEE